MTDTGSVILIPTSEKPRKNKNNNKTGKKDLFHFNRVSQHNVRAGKVASFARAKHNSRTVKQHNVRVQLDFLNKKSVSIINKTGVSSFTCMVRVKPGLAPTAAALLRLSELMSEDLPVLG